MQTLLTGFGPFGNVVSNPTERLVRHFATEAMAEHELTVCHLPTSFARAPALMQCALEQGGRDGRPFDNVLMLGVATGSARWRVERFGRNHDDALTDVDDFTPPARTIIEGAPDLLPVTFPVETMVTALEQAGLPSVASESAGAYLCNHVLFTTLHYLQSAQPSVRAGFLHVPADPQTFRPDLTSAPCFPFAQHIEAVWVVLSALVDAFTPNTLPTQEGRT
jgi:pyroglutamyl-peptidase